ncbi:clathrin interactor 1 isoform X2 [Octopus bimaculoides]|uniref:clathrin interactor 1 isoform X2 n=1 Tax=Octopus bimaculoides TaxID=37653 RepID=UPI0022E1CB72|nr:clathrin interactor 1 isoform X2 [Octopus bimaculoides]
MWKLREITDKVTNVVMNYSDVEAKVREATNDDAWGPHGSLMGEIAQYTFTYEHFPEVMGMLWKRMLHDNKKNWRRVYKSLLLLSYLVKNGSERVVTSSREHLYDLRSLENYTYTDENGKDQGLNVRQKGKELIDFIQDDERLRDERKKAKKTKDKYIGMASDSHGIRYRDRYDEDYRSTPSATSSHIGRLDDIDDWNRGKKSVASEAIDKVKDLWHRAHGKKNIDDVIDYSDDNENRYEDKEKPSRDRKEFEFKDEDEEYTSVERTQTTHTEKITTNIRTTRSNKKLDLGAAANYGKETNQVPDSSGNYNLIDTVVASVSSPGDLFTDFSDFKSSASQNGVTTDIASSNSNGEFGEFSAFQGVAATSVTSSSQSNFADFSKMNTAAPQNSSSVQPVVASTTPSADLYDVFSTPVSNPASGGSIPPMQAPNLASPLNPSGTLTSQITTGSAISMQTLSGMSLGTSTVPMQGIGMMPSTMMFQANMMSPQSTTMMSPPAMMSPPTMMSGAGTPFSTPTGAVNPIPAMAIPMSIPQTSSNNTWTDSSGLNISLDSLNPNARFQKSTAPSMNQLQQQGLMAKGVVIWYPDSATAAAAAAAAASSTTYPNATVSGTPGNQFMGTTPSGMNAASSGLNQRMGSLNLGGSPVIQPQTTGNLVGTPTGMMGVSGGGDFNMPATAGLPTNLMNSPTSFQQRTNQAFSDFGNVMSK